MFESSQRRLDRLLDGADPQLLSGGLKGLEKESLRVGADVHIAQTPHPRALGSALTHPSITTDYSEALLEFITPPYPELRETLKSLADIHAFVYQHIGEEMLWATSMPCVVGGDASIPIAEYGSSNIGRMKHVYRRGLAWRYGRVMQAISGVHFNYSPPPALWPRLQQLEDDGDSAERFRSRLYFRLIRNVQRHNWVLSYLFGASPAICRSFLQGRTSRFQDFDPCTVYEPYATSLRMSDIGYKNKAQAGLRVSYDDLDSYVASLTRAISTPDPEYLALGVCMDGDYRQLNGNILQIENEYYSAIRPKAVARSGERPTLALRRKGVEYVEVRALDVNAFDPLGVDPGELRFVEAFLLLCLLEDSPPVSTEEQREIDDNQAQVSRRGRQPGLRLRWQGHDLSLRDWGLRLCDALEPVCAALDAAGGRDYRDALDEQRLKFEDPEATPSARVLREMRERGESFVTFATRLSRQHERFFKELRMPPATVREFEEAAATSLAEQAAIEAADDLSFEDYLARYFAQA